MTGEALKKGRRVASDRPPPTPTKGDVIGHRYRVVRTLGRGGMAMVVEVEELSTGQRLALKRLRVAESARPVQAELFELEYHTLSQLRHPAIVQVHEFGRDKWGPFYTMELLDGGELRALAPLPWPKVCALLIDICSALSLVHSRRLVHRDVTARNIWCTRAGEARLIDFGAMTAAGPSTDVVGTPPFCAPEIFGLQGVDARTDIYALGAAA